jgi:hypothetical protein
VNLPEIESATSVPAEQIPVLLARLAALQGALAARLLTTSIPAAAPAPEWALTADDVARRLGRSRRWVFRNAKRLPFVRRVSRKVIVADEAALKRWIASRPRL